MENIRSTIEIGKNLCDLTGPWVEYHNNLDTNMETLKRKTKQLNRRNNDINVEVNYAEKWSGKKRRVEVELWQEYVRRITADVQTLERQEQEVRGLNNALKRARWRQRVVDKIEEVKKLYENGEFSNGLLIDDPTRGHAIPTASLAEPTSVRNREKIWNFLMDDAVRKIGVHGMAGVGKTIIMKSINNQLMKSMNNQLLSGYSTFSDVIWVTVSKASDIKNLQGKIAKKLKIDLFDNEDELRSASEINKMLSQKKRYVLILDDLWKEFPLEKIGIPEPTRDNGCKLVLTTRLVDVCTKMNCRPVEMELLTEEEALNLFMNYVKEHQTMLATEPEEIAKEVAKKCARLPLAIVVMAGCMRRVNDIREWRNARNVQWLLDKEGLFEQLKFSYSRLKDEQERHCFLYCALYPEDHDIDREELIEYWIDEELISEKNSIEAMFDQGHYILNKLIKSCLLVKSITYGIECVKMHDLIRDMALKIISASPQFMVRAGEGLKRVPHKDWSGDLERVSLMLNQCHIEELPSEPPNCPYLGGKQDKDKACLRDTSVDSASCSDTSNDDKDDDSFRMNMEPLYSISSNGSFKRNIKYWQKGECLGSGSFGTVYEGVTDDGFFFAAKEASLLDQESQSILQEISLLSQFEHENIVQYLGTDEVDSKRYIFLELVTKGSLVSLYQKYQLRDPQVSQYTRQILNGLNYLHSRNVVHRDIKCANILVDASGSVKLADFGLAKATTLNDIKSCKGTARWMAPEVVNQDGYGLAADIWSLGCTVLEMLTRKIPYSHLEWMAALFRIGKGELPRIPNSLSSDAQDFIFKCLKVNPNYRPTAAELLNHPFVKRPMAQGLKNFDQPLAIEDVRF